VINNKEPHQAQGAAHRSAAAVDINTKAADRLTKETNKNTVVVDKNAKAADKNAEDIDKNAEDTRRRAEIASKSAEAENKITRRKADEADAHDVNTEAPAYDDRGRFSGDTTKADTTKQAGDEMEDTDWMEMGLVTDTMEWHGNNVEETPLVEKNDGLNNLAKEHSNMIKRTSVDKKIGRQLSRKVNQPVGVTEKIEIVYSKSI
jgi:hypothetical protein